MKEVIITVSPPFAHTGFLLQYDSLAPVETWALLFLCYFIRAATLKTCAHTLRLDIHDRKLYYYLFE